MTLETIQPLIDWIASHPELAGVVVFLIAFTESLALVGIVVPGIVFMLSVGTLVGLGAINLWSALIWAALGAVAGDGVSYWLGHHFDRQLRHVWPLSRYPKLIPRGERFFKRHGGKSILFGRFVGPLRPVIPAVAGIMHMSPPKFYFMNVLSAILWAPVVILPGVAFGNSLQLAEEVFGKLILLIVILILIAAFFGYLAKKMFAYALMTTVSTWGEFFGFDKARENLTSVALVGVLIATLGWFVGQYENRYQSVVTEEQARNYQWWQNNWQIFSPPTASAKRFNKRYPITIQWWGSLKNIKAKLESQQWQPADDLHLNNALNYFLSSPDILKLPVRKHRLFKSYEKLIMVKRTDNKEEFTILRLWAASTRQLAPEEQLWLGALYTVKVISPFGLAHVLVRDKNYQQSLRLFKQHMSTQRDISVKQKLYPDVSSAPNWNGEVLLMSFTDSSLIRISTEQEKTILRKFIMEDAGITMLAPPGFVGNTAEGFGYQYNGVNLRLKRYEVGRGTTSNITRVTDLLRKQLKDSDHSPLISLSESDFHQSGLEGTQFVARYDMPFLGKKLIYRVKVFNSADATWVATGVAKQCDDAGLKLVISVLESLANGATVN